jgi:hypothetical protein
MQRSFPPIELRRANNALTGARKIDMRGAAARKLSGYGNRSPAQKLAPTVPNNVLTSDRLAKAAPLATCFLNHLTSRRRKRE